MSQPGPQAIDWLSLPAMRPVAWWRDALRLWRRAPIRWTIACLVPTLVELPFQWFVPVAGVTLSKIVAFLFAFGLIALMDDLARNGRFSWRHLFWSFRPRNFVRALPVSIAMLSLIAVDVLVVYAAYGWAGVDALLLGNVQAHKELMTERFSLVMMLPGIVAGTIFLFAPGLLVLGAVSPRKAIAWSARWLVMRPMAFAITAGISVVLMGIAMPRFWPVLFVLPWMAAMGYTAYLDVFGREAPPTPEGLPPKPVTLG